MSEQVLVNDTTDKRLNEIESSLAELKTMMQRLHYAVVGNQELDQMGLIGRIKKLEEEHETAKEFKNKVLGIGAGAGIVTAFVFELLKNMLFK
jgi:hypothetical protein